MPFVVPTALLIGTWLTSVGTGLNLAIPMILFSAIWAAMDSTKVGARHFRGLVAILWIVAFPAYLVLRERIRGGMAEPRPGLSSDEVRRLVLAALR